MTSRFNVVMGLYAAISLVFLFTTFMPLKIQVDDNFAHLLVLQAYLAPTKQDERIQKLHLAQQLQCHWQVVMLCNDKLMETDEAILQTADQLFFSSFSPISVITQTSSLSTQLLTLGGHSESNQSTQLQQVADGYRSLFGAGYLRARLFFFGR